MTKKTWHFQLEDGFHTVELDYGYFSGKRQIRVDGEVALQTGPHPFTSFSVDRVNVGRHSATVVIRANFSGFNYIYDIALDDEPTLEGGQYVRPMLPAPLWAWLFVLGCVIIGIWASTIVHNQLVAHLIAVAAAVQCFVYLMDRSAPVEDRIRKCAIVTLACVGLLSVLVFAYLLGWRFG